MIFSYFCENEIYMRSILVFFLCTLLASCVPDMKERGYDTKKLAEEIKDRKIKKLTPTQINAWVYERGLQITQILDKSACKLHSSQSSEPSEMLRSYQELPSLDSLQKVYKIQIQPLNLQDSQSLKRFGGKTQQVLEASSFQAEQKQDIQANLQKLENGDFLFIKGLECSKNMIWFVLLPQKEVIRKIDQKEFNP
jgi:hypothetical protein